MLEMECGLSQLDSLLVVYSLRSSLVASSLSAPSVSDSLLVPPFSQCLLLFLSSTGHKTACQVVIV